MVSTAKKPISIVVLRVDAAVEIGTGHVMRCLTLANALREQGAECHFLCREHPGHLINMIEARGFIAHRLPILSQAGGTGPDSDAQPVHAHWLGTSWQADAEACRPLLMHLAPDWLVVDHYALDAKWERALTNAVGNIMVIDDLANRPHECTVLLDQNALDHSIIERYERIVSENCTLLLGPKYALLRPEYAELAKSLPERDGVISRVLIFVGGSDPYHLTERYLRALAGPEFKHLFVDVVIGKNHPSPAIVENLVEARSKTRLYSALPSLAALMVRSDLMLGAGGATNWERMCLGLNSIVTSVASNQDEINRTLVRKGLIEFLGPADKLTDTAVTLAIENALQNLEVNTKRSAAMRKVVDGRGTEYVIRELLEK
ncbi:UDP-2,4-diacetamido-2,4, 6-trideoxy-beta-L-altropyranose hydrolase [Vreelandella rituensis]|uniref:UDP-2,4-diacetamido-2,4, 6-trideoxy-beta-L-altropyranose hydrolase n=1 Tax=Vreelandella rituensis TaxID=2282306 RepID=A0A368UAA1_9GAMM|nr:UDP-2,4-diacetamido-2,4,6-trideoxy-beta-L-altropyranose hydrolase [Halomonas rituensis]RCV93387.1 UDP-2,4-diacetamido-2,4,6-trideoxy-beta-L-altropyranose hydrolase [Halomonas rituensis]